MILFDKEIINLLWDKGFRNKFNKDKDYYFWLCDLQKYLREIHNTNVESRGIRYAGDEKSSYYQPCINGSIIDLKRYSTYEESLEIGLQRTLLIINL